MTMIAPMGEIGAFRFWCQKVLPAVYDDSLSYYELLAKVIDKLNEVIEAYSGSGETIQYILNQLVEIQNEFDEFKEGGFEEYYEAQLDRWIHENMENIIGQSIKMVFFGLTLNGHFVAYIPDSWNEIVFDTGAVYGYDTYGRLILRYNVDNASEDVLQPYEPSFENVAFDSIRYIMSTLYE